MRLVGIQLYNSDMTHLEIPDKPPTLHNEIAVATEPLRELLPHMKTSLREVKRVQETYDYSPVLEEWKKEEAKNKYKYFADKTTEYFEHLGDLIVSKFAESIELLEHLLENLSTAPEDFEFEHRGNDFTLSDTNTGNVFTWLADETGIVDLFIKMSDDPSKFVAYRYFPVFQDPENKPETPLHARFWEDTDFSDDFTPNPFNPLYQPDEYHSLLVDPTFATRTGIVVELSIEPGRIHIGLVGHAFRLYEEPDGSQTLYHVSSRVMPYQEGGIEGVEETDSDANNPIVKFGM